MASYSKNLSAAGADAVRMSADAAAVIPIRCVRISRGGQAGLVEAQLMMSEKAQALAHVTWSTMMGAYGFTPDSVTRGVIAHYAACVNSNRRRLNSTARQSKKRRSR